MVQALLSLQEVPFAFSAFEHWPVEGLQTPSSWHASPGWQTTGAPEVQLPDWHESPVVQALPSSQGEPFGFGAFVQWPPSGLQTPPSLQPSPDGQTTGAPAVQLPAWQESPDVQRLPSSQAVPFGLAICEHWPVVGSHVPASWQASPAWHCIGVPGMQAPA